MRSVSRGFYSKKTGIEGKVVDGRGRPVANVKGIARVHFETTTDSDGKFCFKGIYPTSEYTLKLESEVHKTYRETIIKSGPEGQMSILPFPIEVRFAILKEGIMTDSETGLQWTQEAGQPRMTWYEANNYVKNLKLGGYFDWRLPSKEELESLANHVMSKRGKEEISKFFDKLGFKNVRSDYYWSSTTDASSMHNAWYVCLLNGFVYRHSKDSYNYVWPVRSGL